MLRLYRCAWFNTHYSYSYITSYSYNLHNSYNCIAHTVATCSSLLFTVAQLRPQKERILIKGQTKGQNVLASAAALETSGRLPYYKVWSNESMEMAIDSVKRQELSVRRAAEVYSIPKSTLHDRISGKVVHGVYAVDQSHT